MSHLNSPFRLDHKTALITGGSKGIGFGIAKSMIQSGARVVITGRKEATLRKAAVELGSDTAFRVHDVTDFSHTEQMVQELMEQIGSIDILVNNAGNHLKKPALDTTDDEFNRIIQTHLSGSFSLSRSVAAHMKKNGGGSILFIASMASYLAIPKVVAYSAAKSGVLGLVRGLSSELTGFGIRVNAIAPGFIESDMLRNAIDGDPERKDKILSRSPMARFGDPEEIGLACVYLSSPAGAFITGHTLPVDGGFHTSF